MGRVGLFSFFAAVFFFAILVFPLFGATSVGAQLTSKDFEAIFSDTIFYEPIGGGSSLLGGPVAASNNCQLAGLITINDQQALAEAINQYIEDFAPSNSPFIGLGDAFVAGSVRARVNPFVIVSLARKESSFGTEGIAKRGTFNAFGRTATDGQFAAGNALSLENSSGGTRLWYRYDSWRESLDGSGLKDDHPTYFRRVFIDSEPAYIEDIMNVYAPPSENDTQTYIDQIYQWTADMAAYAGDSVDCEALGSGGAANG